MKRREFILGAASIAACAPSGLLRAQSQTRRIGLLSWSAGGTSKRTLREELAALGYIEGGNIEIIEMVADEDSARLARIAREFVATPVDVIVAFATPAVHAAKAATQSIPIVMGNVADPIATGLVQSLSHPGGNITGVTFHGPEVAPKRLQFLREILPGLTRVGFLGSTRDPNTATFVQHIREAADQTGVTLQTELIDAPDQFAAALDALVRGRAEAVMVQPIFIALHAQSLSALATARRLPTISDVAIFAHAGGLMSYGADWAVLGRRAAHYVDRILKGEKPSELPIELPTVFQLVINARTAKALGLTIPPAILLRADEVIE